MYGIHLNDAMLYNYDLIYMTDQSIKPSPQDKINSNRVGLIIYKSFTHFMSLAYSDISVSAQKIQKIG